LREVLKLFGIRMLFAGPLLYLAFSGFLYPFGLFLLALAGWILAEPVALAVSSGFGIYHQGGSRKGPLPAYSLPESKLKKGLYDDAYQLYNEIALEHPQELNAYIGMIRVAQLHLDDPQKAHEAFHWGLSILTDPRSRQALAMEYRELAELEGPPPERETHVEGKPYSALDMEVLQGDSEPSRRGEGENPEQGDGKAGQENG
jgi:hypothetical protein